MDSINVRTPYDFEQIPGSSDKRKRHSSIACSCCRKLKIRCQGGESKTVSASSVPKPCNHCASLGKVCEWPEEDGRKQKRTRQVSAASSGAPYFSTNQDNISFHSPSTGNPTPSVDSDQTGFANLPTHGSITVSGSRGHPHASSLNTSNRSDSNSSETAYTTVHYFRHLGPTAIAPGHKKISLKARQLEQPSAHHSPVPSRSVSNMQPPPLLDQTGCLPLFDEATGLPVEEILSALLDKYFEYYADIYCFTNRRYLEALIDNGTPPVFLICVMTALSSRFCEHELFAPYFPPVERTREDWEYSAPFLERSKSMIMSAMSLPTPDIAAGLLMMAFADFGDNNEAGLWMFTGMALRMVQELGLHRERGCLDRDEPQAETKPNGQRSDNKTIPFPVSLESYQESSEVLLFWAVFSCDTALCNGTGRVPSLKRHEINVRLPSNGDLANIRAGPNGIPRPAKVEVFPQLARMMLSYAQSIDYLNTGASQIRFQSHTEDLARMNRLEALKHNLMSEYRSLPKEVSFGAIFYRGAVNAGQAGPYLLLHLQYLCQIAFLTQESLSEEVNAAEQPQSAPEAADKARLKKTNQELYRKAIKSIADMLTFTKLIDERPLLSVVYLNQPIFHAAAAFSRDMLRRSSTAPPDPKDMPSYAFPIPSDTSPSMVFPDGGVPTKIGDPPRKRSQQAVESTYDFLTLIAKANYQFLRQTIKDQAKVYAGSGWVDAVLDQRETGLRDVDLSIVSDSISTFIRLHDLRLSPGAEAALRQFVPVRTGRADTLNNAVNQLPGWRESQAADLFGEVDLDFDPQAFFNDYLYTELAEQDFPIDGSIPMQPQPFP